MDDRLLFRLALTLLPGIGSISAKNLISYAGSAEAIFHSKGRELKRIPGIGPQLTRKILENREKALKRAEKEVLFLHANPDIRPLFFLDKEYPRRLRHYPDCPFMLFQKGGADLNAPRMVSIVGTRRPSSYGRLHAEQLVNGLLPYGVSIASGLAYGVDATVHRSCLELGIPTIGVLGHGLHMIYPYAHRKLAAQMVDQGSLLSEFHSGLGPEKDHFPMRNRIVAGMCDALIVVETGPRGGSLISAEFANSYNKDVFALPGRIGDPASAGCHFLIKTHRAGLIENAEDIAYRLNWDIDDTPAAEQFSLFEAMDEREQAVARVLQEAEVAGIDKIARETGFQGQELSALVLNMELKGMLRNLPGHRYALRR